MEKGSKCSFIVWGRVADPVKSGNFDTAPVVVFSVRYDRIRFTVEENPDLG